MGGMNMDRAYSFLSIKSLDEDQRVITGMASTPEVDRVGDIVDSLGAKFAAEIPLLWAHKHDSPVGIAELGKPTKKGIPFKAVIAKIEEDGPLKQLVEMAWQSVKARLVRGVSIGFRPIKYDIRSEGGLKFTETEIYELSLVSVPACASATIQTIKALSGYRDAEARGAIPLIDRPVIRPDDMKGAVRLVSASRLASLPLKASR
jgi:HK97 family phage prohead protease